MNKAKPNTKKTPSKKRLGKGLEALLGEDVINVIDEIEKNYNKDAVIQIKINEISPNPFQPRKIFDEEKLQELATSIKNYGLFTPVLVVKTDHGYTLVAGERRYRAAKSIDLETISALVVDFDEAMMAEIGLLENTQREDLNPIEEANSLKLIMEKKKYTQEEMANQLGKSRSHIANMIRLLSLNNKVQQLILEDKISMGHAKVLVGLDDISVDYLIDEILSKNISVRELEKKVNELKNTNDKKPNRTKERSIEIEEIERLLREKFTTKVNVNNNKIEIIFNDNEDLERLLEILNIKID